MLNPSGDIIALIFIDSKFDGLMGLALLLALNSSITNGCDTFGTASLSNICVQVFLHLILFHES